MPDAAKVLKSLKDNGQSFEMAFMVDTTEPEAEVNEISADGACWKVKLSDDSGIQAVALYYDGEMVGDVTVVTGQDGYEAEINVKELVKAGTDANKELFENGNTIDISKVQLQALDYAFNRLVLNAELPVEPTAEPTETVEPTVPSAEPTVPSAEPTVPSAEPTVPTEAPTEPTVEPTKEPCDGGENCPSIQLTDVDRSAKSWYHEAVDWAFVEGITTGTGKNTFSPDAKVTREQAVTFMWRAAGSEQVSGGEPFADVDAGDYSAAAVAWAVANEITDGVSETRFAPENECTRGQIVTFLYREYGEE